MKYPSKMKRTNKFLTNQKSRSEKVAQGKSSNNAVTPLRNVKITDVQKTKSYPIWNEVSGRREMEKALILPIIKSAETVDGR